MQLKSVLLVFHDQMLGIIAFVVFEKKNGKTFLPLLSELFAHKSVQLTENLDIINYISRQLARSVQKKILFLLSGCFLYSNSTAYHIESLCHFITSLHFEEKYRKMLVEFRYSHLLSMCVTYWLKKRNLTADQRMRSCLEEKKLEWLMQVEKQKFKEVE